MSQALNKKTIPEGLKTKRQKVIYQRYMINYRNINCKKHKHLEAKQYAPK